MKKRYKQILIIMVFVFCACILLHQPIMAEVGNSGGFGGGGGSSSGGGSWGGSSSGGGYGSFFVFGSSPAIVIIALIFIAIRLYSARKSGNTSNARSAFNTTYIDESAVVSQIKENDPDFSAEKFRGYVGELYITLQEAWEAKDWKAVRPFESNALFNMHNKQLQEYIDKNWTNHLNMQDVREVSLAKYQIDGDQEVLTVRVNACCVDYTTDDTTGKIISGSESQLHERSYRFEFIRSLGVKTDVQTGLNPTNCPNCGAPTQVTSSGECEYCRSVITNGKYGWVLNKYGAW